MLSETEIIDRFRQHGIFQDDGELYLRVPIALKFVEVCQENELAIIGFEGFYYDDEKETIEPLFDQIADFSALKASSWEEFRNLCNKYSKELIRELSPQERIVINFTVLSQAELEKP
ncbi:hypothetical protein HYR99_30250 [Candidatus Poribacteria bacterium]|nr:hypothetical protein [Candidatus Poribacteria bacterium]